jgi:deoxyribodipyrimidine photolyase-related protein
MSDYCGGCRYDPAAKSGATACPFNLLYWHFLIENADKLGCNPRMAMPYRSLAAMPEARRMTITAEAEKFLQSLENWSPDE